MQFLFLFIALLGLLIFYFVGLYNALVSTRNIVKNAWGQIDVHLKRRHDLIPNLVETVKGYAKHEDETLTGVIEARQQAVSITGDNVTAQAQAENMLSSSLKSLFAVSENYPELKANQNFLQLQEEITSTENKIAYARQFYNDAVMTLNNKVEMFPSNFVASAFSFTAAAYFELEVEEERDVPKVEF